MRAGAGAEVRHLCEVTCCDGSGSVAAEQSKIDATAVRLM